MCEPNHPPQGFCDIWENERWNSGQKRRFFSIVYAHHMNTAVRLHVFLLLVDSIESKLLAIFGNFWGVRALEVWHFCPNMPPGLVSNGKKENLLAHQKWACASNFCEPNFQEFRLKWWRKELFLHCGDELNGLGTTWMGLTQGNVIFDILEPPAFPKYSICWIFQAFFSSNHLPVN